MKGFDIWRLIFAFAPVALAFRAFVTVAALISDQGPSNQVIINTGILEIDRTVVVHDRPARES